VSFAWIVYSRDEKLQLQGEVDDYDKLNLTPKYNDCGTWTMDLDARAAQAAGLVRPGWGIVAVRDGVTVLSGPVLARRRQVSDNSQQLTLSGEDDSYWLRKRLASPSPAESVPPYVAQDYDVRTGVCSTVLTQYVNVNLGPGAVSVRRKSGLVMGADPGVGATVTGRARWQLLLTMMQELATTGGIGFRLVQSGQTLQFQTYAVADKTGSVKFSLELGNLAAYDYSLDAPDYNYCYVGGGGEGTARVFKEQPDSESIAAWGRLEGELVDRRDTSSSTEMAQAATEALAQSQERVSLSINPIDTPQIAYLTHYNLGDMVTVQVEDSPDGQIREVVREVSIDLTPDGVNVAPKVGTPGRQEIFRLFRTIRQLRNRVINLERR
jgi:hypothetical protein